MVGNLSEQRSDLTLKHYTRLVIAFLFSLILLSLYQYTTLYFKGVVDSIFSNSFLMAVAHHIGYSAIIGLLFVAPFHFLEKWKYRRGFKFAMWTLILLLILEAMLIGYYTTTFVPLGADLLGYSWEDIKETVFNSGGISFVQILLIVAVAAIFYGIYRFTAKYYHLISGMFPFTFILFTIFIATLFLGGKPINENKTQYLVVNLYLGSLEDDSYVENEENVEYPLLKDNEVPNVLGEHFNLGEEKPDIVFLMIEGLGRDFVGAEAEFGGFTPYLDSLTQKSLYFENCLSNTGRTFGVLPSLIGSLPFGKKGFMELETSPNRHTLFSILKNDGYFTSFLQGTNSSFDNVDNFLVEENVDFVLERSRFGDGYELSPADASGSSWGYTDRELFRKSLSLKRDIKGPKLDVYMTISNHEPFIPPKQAYFERQVEKLLKTSKLNRKAKRVVDKNKNVFATLLYTDDAIKYFMESYKRQNKNYENTIFIITGDHRLVPIRQRNTLSRFHVPLIVYSPMLKAPKKVSAINSHFDVTPSILSLLKEKYNIAMPIKTAWMGGGLDMETSFRGTKSIPLMRNKNELKEYVHNNKFFSDGDVYKIDKNMNLSSASDSKLKKMLNDFKSMNAYVTGNNKIIPDSLSIFKVEKEVFTEEEMVYINSVLTENNFDKAYMVARELAFDKERENALLVCRYILSNVPSHIDTKILSGRVNAWEGNYETAIEIFLECIKTNPFYDDPYAALLDVYFWSDRDKPALALLDVIKENSIKSKDVNKRVSRAIRQAKKNSASVAKKKPKTTDEVSEIQFE